jgi:hypothetical protein
VEIPDSMPIDPYLDEAPPTTAAPRRRPDAI